jgi:hypothetical protein
MVTWQAVSGSRSAMAGILARSLAQSMPLKVVESLLSKGCECTSMRLQPS